jgi:hypothetical protein
METAARLRDEYQVPARSDIALEIRKSSPERIRMRRDKRHRVQVDGLRNTLTLQGAPSRHPDEIRNSPKKRLRPTSDLIRGNWLYLATLKLFSSTLGLHQPCLIQLMLGHVVETQEKPLCKCGAVVGRQTENLLL